MSSHRSNVRQREPADSPPARGKVPPAESSRTGVGGPIRTQSNRPEASSKWGPMGAMLLHGKEQPEHPPTCVVYRGWLHRAGLSLLWLSGFCINP